MARDCEEFSKEAGVIFKRLEPFFPPDPWKNPQWMEEGIVIDNGKFDLRLSADRQKLIQKIESTLGYFVQNAASAYRARRSPRSLEGFETEHFGEMIKNKAELLLIIEDLDFQIETYDAVSI